MFSTTKWYPFPVHRRRPRVQCPIDFLCPDHKSPHRQPSDKQHTIWHQLRLVLSSEVNQQNGRERVLWCLGRRSFYQSIRRFSSPTHRWWLIDKVTLTCLWLPIVDHILETGNFLDFQHTSTVAKPLHERLRLKGDVRQAFETSHEHWPWQSIGTLRISIVWRPGSHQTFFGPLSVSLGWVFPHIEQAHVKRAVCCIGIIVVYIQKIVFDLSNRRSLVSHP